MKTINVVITYEEVLELLKKQIKESSLKAPLSEFLEANLSEEYKITQLYKILNGISIEPKVKTGETYWVKWHNLPSWKFDKPKMRESSLLVEDCVLCKVIEVNKYQEETVKVAYEFIDDQGNRKNDSYNLKESALTDKNEEFPF